MSELTFSPVFEEITHTFRDEPFSAMYFGQHCGKNLLILKHDLSIMIAFGDEIDWSNPDVIKSVTTRGESVKGVHIVGNEEDIILMLSESGNLWRLINAFDFSEKTYESLHTVTDNCFYEWVPFKKFKFAKVLTVCATKRGFACIGLSLKFEKKIAVLSSMNLPVEEFTFDGLNAIDSFSYFLIYLNINFENSVLKNKLDSTADTFLVTDRLKGRTYLCTRDGQNCLINKSNIFLISALHYLQEKCVILCFESGKLFFYFYNEPERHHVKYLPRKLVAIEKCCCLDFCLLWTDGIYLHHTKFTFESDGILNVLHLKLFCFVQTPVSFLKIHHCILTTTINNIYYMITAGSVPGAQIKRNPKEFLNDIHESSWNIDELEQSIDKLSHYLYCKDIMEGCNVAEKVELRWEGDSLTVRSLLGVCLRHEFWKLRLKMQVHEKELMHMVDFKFDVSEGMCIRVDNPFRCKGKVKVSLVGNFGETDLFLDLGEVGNPEIDFKKMRLSKCLKNIFIKKNPTHVK